MAFPWLALATAAGAGISAGTQRDNRGYGQFNPDQMAEIHRWNRQRFGFEKTLQPGQLARQGTINKSLLGRLRGANMQRGMGRNMFAQGTEVLRNNPYELSTREANEMTALNTSRGRGELGGLTSRLARTVGLESSQAQRGIMGSLQGIAQRGRFAINQEQFGREQAGRGLAFRLQQAGTGFQRV